MWATLAIASALSLAPAQAGTLEIKNDRVTHGIFGQDRKDASLLAGDIFVVTFDIEGLQVNAEGRVRYSMGMSLINNKTGMAEFTKEPQELEAVNALGGTRLPAFAMTEIGTDTVPGSYTLKATVTDLSSKEKTKPTTTLTKKFEVLPKKFGFTRVALSSEGGSPVPPLAVPGQTFIVNFAMVGFEVDDKTQPDIVVEMTILDKDGKPTLPKPFTGDAKANIPAKFKNLLPMQFVLAVNRSGDFTVQLKATDKKGNKTAEASIAIRVVEMK